MGRGVGSMRLVWKIGSMRVERDLSSEATSGFRRDGWPQFASCWKMDRWAVQYRPRGVL